MSFIGEAFLVAMTLAGVPALLHLLHRKRFKTVRWAAMDFLLDAVQRQRRWLEFRDLLLMLLRTAVVVMFILAMAQPFWVSGAGSPEPTGPVHVVLVIDNSLSMAYRPFDATLLDMAKDKARELIERLPDGSAISIVPACAVGDFHLRDTYLSRDDALDALNDITVVDRSAWAGTSAEDVKRALQTMDSIPTKRVILLGDQQQSAWAGGVTKAFHGIEEVQIAPIGEQPESNTWIESFRMRDGFASRDAPASLSAIIRHKGPPRPGVRVQLRVDGVVVEERYVDLEDGIFAELVFEHSFEAMGTPDRPVFVPVSLDLAEDRLPEDDHRWMIVPVVAAAPVVCIDTLGGAEDPRLNQYGETYPVRRLLQPATRQEADEFGQAIEIRHVTPSQVTRDTLADARLVLIAGTAAPSAEFVQLLRSYAEQGGSVVITAGGWFEPERWSKAAWLEGEGILPLPLMPDAIGKIPAPGDDTFETFRFDPSTVTDPLLDLGLPEAAARDLLMGPYFFKVIGTDESVLPQFTKTTEAKLQSRRAWITQNNADEARWAELERAGQLDPTERAARDAAREERRELTGRWLKWVNPLAIDPDLIPIDELAKRYRPQVMLRYDNGVPFAVRRGAGRGQIVFLSTGLLPRWNSLASDHAVILIDQMIRGLVTQTIPSRNLGPTNQIVIPLEAAMEGQSFVLYPPVTPGIDPQPRAVVPEAIGPDRQGLMIREVHQRGVYRLYKDAPGERPDTNPDAIPHLMLAINGPSDEGDLSRADSDAIIESLGTTLATVTPPGTPLSLSGKTYLGRSLWRWLLLLTLLLLIAEMVVLAMPHRHREEAVSLHAAGAFKGVPA